MGAAERWEPIARGARHARHAHGGCARGAQGEDDGAGRRGGRGVIMCGRGGVVWGEGAGEAFCGLGRGTTPHALCRASSEVRDSAT